MIRKLLIAATLTALTLTTSFAIIAMVPFSHHEAYGYVRACAVQG